MKKYLLILAMFIFSADQLYAQNILVVNDNDNITLNTDTLLAALDQTIYSNYDYWSVPDSAGVVPSTAIMNGYQLVIWYASTDGVGLTMWGGSNTGDTNLVNYIKTGKPLWIIGQDILFDQYPAYGAFGAGDFAYDYMGLDAYNVQSYVDDGSLGVSIIEKMPDAPASFLNSIEWIFSTLWYVDGCTPSTGTLKMYSMGPSAYTLAGEVCMFHKKTSAQSVMSTFFDPALINTQANRITFLEKGITYLLNGGVGVNNVEQNEVSIWPNPANDRILIKANTHGIQHVIVSNLAGAVMQQQYFNHAAQVDMPLNQLPAGMYSVQVTMENGGRNTQLIQVQ